MDPFKKFTMKHLNIGDIAYCRAERFLHYPFFRVHVSFIIKIRGSGTGPGYPTGPVFCAVVAGYSPYISSEGILRVFWP